jgi:hypothetical protein
MSTFGSVSSARDGELVLLSAGEHAAFPHEGFHEDGEEREDAVELPAVFFP